MKTALRRRWYQFCVAFQRLDVAARKKVFPSKSTRAGCMRISLLHRHLGEPLDEAEAPLRCYLFVAWAPDSLVVPQNMHQRTRHQALMAFFELRHRWPSPAEIKILMKQVATRLGLSVPLAQPEAEKGASEQLAATLATSLAAQHPELALVLGEFARKPRQPPPEGTTL